MIYDIIVIGGGASGMCTAIKAKKENNRILIIEHGPKLGKKILSTGNGKCNLTNMSCRVSLFNDNPEKIYPYFSEGDKAFAENVIDRFDCDDTVRFFRELGILTENKNGYVYPRSEQASTVLDVFIDKIDALGIDVVTEYQIKKISEVKGGFDIDGKYRGKKLVLASGGMSAPKTGSDGSGYELAKMLGHTAISPRPALCAVKCSDRFFKSIAGVRSDGQIRLFREDGTLAAEITGNIQFTDYGISGIPVFQISSLIGKMFDRGEKPAIEIDLLPEMTERELEDFIWERDHDYLLGTINSKLSGACGQIAGYGGVDRQSMVYIKKLCETVKHFKVNPASLVSFDNSQVTAGGIPISEIDPETMESKLVKGLYFTGEIIDVNGICGGYNLQWAWASAHVCAAAILKEPEKED